MALLGSPTWADEPPKAGRLELGAEATLRPGGGLNLRVTLRNVSAEDLTFFLPEHAAMTWFPTWRLVGDDGVAFEPYASPYQSMWTEGVQGSLVPIAAHAEWKADYDVDLFLAVGPQAAAAADLTPLPLPPGRYRVLCSYEQPDAAVPVGGPDFELTARVIPGLWTGKIAAPTVALTVPRAPIVSLRVDGPRDVVAGQPYPLTVVLRNDTPTTQVLCGSLTLSASSKALGTFTSRVLLGATSRAASAGESQTVELAAGVERSFVVDLRALVFLGGRRAGAALPLAKALGQGVFALDASFGASDLAPPLTSNGLWRYVAPAEPRAR